MIKRIHKVGILAAFLFLISMPAAAKIRLVATVPELGDISGRIAGDLASVDVLARGTEDIHQVTMRPSYLPRLNRADAVVFLGLGVEHTFLPGLLGAAANPRIRADPEKDCSGEGCIDCSVGVSVLDKPSSLSRAEGEQHPQGNPHYNLNPGNGAVIARNIAAGLAGIDPANADRYRANLKTYLAELETKLADWRRRAGPLKGLKAVSYHQDTTYLGRFTGLEFAGTVEPKPGIAPTPRHLEGLVAMMKDQGVKIIVREQQYEPKTCDWLAERTGAKVAVIGTMAGAFPGPKTFAELSERNLAALLDAAAAAQLVK